MLRGIPDIIGSDLLKALADTGHGDLIAIVDHFYPPITKAPNAVSIQAKGCGVAQMLDAILKLVPLDVDFEKYPIQYMIPDADSGMTVITDCMVIASGRSALQVKTLADEVEDRLSEGGVYPLRKEGQQEGRWVVLDYGTVLVHIFHTEEREFYRLDKLWEADNNRIALPFEESEEG